MTLLILGEFFLGLTFTIVTCTAAYSYFKPKNIRIRLQHKESLARIELDKLKEANKLIEHVEDGRALPDGRPRTSA